MAGVAGAKNTYSAGVQIGNWVEDAWGKRHSQRMNGGAPPTGTTEHRSRYEVPPPGSGATAPLTTKAIDALDGHLMLAHGTNIVNRNVANNHYVTSSQAQFGGIRSDVLLDGKAPLGTRTNLLRQKSTMESAGLDGWEVTGQRNNAAPELIGTIAPTKLLPTKGNGLQVPIDIAMSAGAFAVLCPDALRAKNNQNMPPPVTTASYSTLKGHGGNVSVSAMALSNTAMLTKVAQPEPTQFRRTGSFTRTFKR